MKKSAILMLLPLFFLLTGCKINGTAQDVIGIRGSITQITSRQGGITLLVEGTQEADTHYDKASVTVDAETVILDSSGTQTDLASLKTNDQIEVVFRGPVAESYPVQGTAKQIRILQPSP